MKALFEIFNEHFFPETDDSSPDQPTARMIRTPEDHARALIRYALQHNLIDFLALYEEQKSDLIIQEFICAAYRSQEPLDTIRFGDARNEKEIGVLNKKIRYAIEMFESAVSGSGSVEQITRKLHKGKPDDETHWSLYYTNMGISPDGKLTLSQVESTMQTMLFKKPGLELQFSIAKNNGFIRRLFGRGSTQASTVTICLKDEKGRPSKSVYIKPSENCTQKDLTALLDQLDPSRKLKSKEQCTQESRERLQQLKESNFQNGRSKPGVFACGGDTSFNLLQLVSQSILKSPQPTARDTVESYREILNFFLVFRKADKQKGLDRNTRIRIAMCLSNHFSSSISRDIYCELLMKYNEAEELDITNPGLPALIEGIRKTRPKHNPSDRTIDRLVDLKDHFFLIRALDSNTRKAQDTKDEHDGRLSSAEKGLSS